MGEINRYGVREEDQSTINIISSGLLCIDQRSINCGVQVQGFFSKIRGIFYSRRPVTIEKDNAPGQWER